MKTERLYYDDAYLTAFSASVVEAADGGRRVYLDQTAYYPTSGGQPADRGTLNSVPVLDVIDEGERIAHVLEAPINATQVAGSVDWGRRFDHMQQHTAQHLLSAVCADMYGYETLSVHFGADYATVDLGTESLSPSETQRLQDRCNTLLVENREVAISFEDAATAAGLRKPSERDGELRIVTIEGIDRSACGGTHVRRLGELGAILLRGHERMKQHTRLTFLAGHRAIRAATVDFQTIVGLARTLNCAPAELTTVVPAQAEELRAITQQLKRADDQLATFKAADAYARIAPDESGVRWLVEQREDPADGARALALAFTSHPKSVFVALSTVGPAVLVASSEDSGLDAGAWLRTTIAEHGGKGGGSARLAQGRVPSVEVLHRIASSLSHP